ncbi:unnamed protein product [Periconia digitata]|uniref:Rhodopsin domain-containing protein n=1 Tax=Periconia digitata TaxID=1303443 RepID=A0A9W4UU54_9PLEO|nr:unnamed protein product [Periconia digitata]
MAEEKVSPAGYALAVMNAIILFLSWATIGARITIRHSGHKYGKDDTLMLVSLFFFTLFAVFVFCAIDNFIFSPSDHPNWTSDERRKAGLFYYLAQLTYTLAIVCTRTSIALALLRIARKKWHQAILYGTIALMSVTALATAATLAASTSHIQKQFDSGTRPRSRSDALRTMVFIFSATSAVEDIVIVVMPYLMLYNLQRDRAERRGLILLLAMGGAAIVANVARIPFLPGVGRSGPGQRAGLFFCSLFELGIGMLAGSAVMLRTTWRQFWEGRGWGRRSVNVELSRRS